MTTYRATAHVRWARSRGMSPRDIGIQLGRNDVWTWAEAAQVVAEAWGVLPGKPRLQVTHSRESAPGGLPRGQMTKREINSAGNSR